MGGIFSCCFGDDKDERGNTTGGGGGSNAGHDAYQTFPATGDRGPHQPDPEEKRRQLAEAAEKRRETQEHRGVKDPDVVRRQQKRQEEMERLEKEAILKGGTGGGLKWQVS